MKKMLLFSLLVSSMMVHQVDAMKPDDQQPKEDGFFARATGVAKRVLKRARNPMSSDESSSAVVQPEESDQQNAPKASRVGPKEEAKEAVVAQHAIRIMPQNIEEYLMLLAFEISDGLIMKLIKARLCVFSDKELATLHDLLLNEIRQMVERRWATVITKVTSDSVLRKSDNFELLYEIIFSDPSQSAIAISQMQEREKKALTDRATELGVSFIKTQDCPICTNTVALIELPCCKQAVCADCLSTVLAEALGAKLHGVVAKSISACPFCRKEFDESLSIFLAETPGYDTKFKKADAEATRLAREEAVQAEQIAQ